MSNSLQGRVAFVTGAGRGIGRAIAAVLAGEGAIVTTVSRTAGEIAETVRQIEEAGGQAIYFQADVADYESISSVVEQVLDRFGRIDILVNNAGIQAPIGPLVTNDWQAWAANIGVNLIGTFNCCHAVLPGMIARKAGKIINFSGGGATGPRPNFSAYAAAKAAVVRLTETLAEEVKVHHIHVNAVAPGAVNTRMLDEVLQAGDLAGAEWEAAQKRQDAGGVPPELAARLVTFLASDAANGLTGKLIAAPYDDWAGWSEETIGELSTTSWLTLRRIDPFTLNSVSAGEPENGIAEKI